MEEYEGIKNRAPDIYNTSHMSNVTVKTSTSEGQQPELWSPAKEITNQTGLELEEDQLDNARILRTTSGNAKRLKSRVLTKVEKSAKIAMR